jgi:hypothetical protein
MKVLPGHVAPTQLLLDPNNYRFHDLQGYKPVTNRSRYAEPGVQARALTHLQDTEAFELEPLKDSIATNGYIPLEQIVVEAYGEAEGSDTLYLVIEGNRRVAAVKVLLDEHSFGAVDISDEKLTTLTQLPVLEIVGTPDEKLEYQQTLMAIRHIAGIKAWGPYQQARLITELHDKSGSFSIVAQRVGISSREVGRRFRAAKALRQMEEDEEFGEHASPKLYSLFHEAISQPKVREWLDFSDGTFQAENPENRRSFYELLSPRVVEGVMHPAKLQDNRQVRRLQDIVDKPVPLRILLDPERTLADATRAADDETVHEDTGVLEHAIGQALHALKSPGIGLWVEPSERALELWNEFVRLVDQIRGMLNRQ